MNIEIAEKILEAPINRNIGHIPSEQMEQIMPCSNLDSAIIIDAESAKTD